jgi:HlyD family type I secretion membrane fusion protein
LSRIASLRTRITEATSSAAEADLEIKRITAEFLEGLGSERLEYQQQIAELQEELAAAADVMDRSVLTAPETGAVINLKFRTDDGVVGPGEPILEIVPSDSTFYAILELNPQDRDSISEGMNVEVRLSGIDSWRIRPIQAKVIGISADLKQSGDAGYTYYEVKAVMSKPSEHGLDPQLMPGMPVEVFLPSGQAKTLLGYLAEPVTAIMRRGMRE